MSARDITLPAECYRGDMLYESERRNIFARSWLLIAHESQLPDVGSYMAVSVAGYPLIVVRGEGNKIHAFHNVCRHRAGPERRRENVGGRGGILNGVVATITTDR